MNRRKFVAGVLATPFILSTRTFAQASVFIGDMHTHSFFAESKYHFRPLAKSMAAGDATLIAWSLVGDLLWFDVKTYKEKSTPARGETFGWFQRELGRIRAHIAEQGLRTIQTARDVDLALQGKPHVVLSVEGANFIENDAGRVKFAFDAGIRQLQLVHYTSNSIGDIQTSPGQHNGLSEVGKKVVAECNRAGMLIDLAHCSEATTKAALAISKAPMVWSHGSVSKAPAATEGPIWRRRQLSFDLAKEIASKGGVVGLWALAQDVGKTVESYADRVLQLADWLGEDHVALGTDINGLGPFATIKEFANYKGMIAHWRRKGVNEARITKLAIGNYARVLKTAMEQRG